MSQNKLIEAKGPDPEVIPRAKRRRLKAFAEARLPEEPSAGKTCPERSRRAARRSLF